MPAERPEHFSNLEVPNVADVNLSDESENDAPVDGDTPASSGYELLPSDPAVENVSDDDEHENNSEDSVGETTQSATVVTTTANNVASWVPVFPQDPLSRQFEEALQSADSVHLKNSDFPIEHKPRYQSVPMSSDQIETIKNCMSKIVLPQSNHPSWASDVPEDEWKKHLLSRIQNYSKLNQQ